MEAVCRAKVIRTALKPLIDHHNIDNYTTPPETLPRSAYDKMLSLRTAGASATFRELYTRDIGWFLLTTEVKEALVSLLRDEVVLEVGCGTGYLAYHLMKSGVKDYTAIDLRDSQWWGEGNIYFAGEEADATEYPLTGYTVLICCWPPMSGTYWETVLRNMLPGQSILIQGETSGGCCGTDAAWDYLENCFDNRSDELTAINKDHVRICGYHDEWMLFTKRG